MSFSFSMLRSIMNGWSHAHSQACMHVHAFAKALHICAIVHGLYIERVYNQYNMNTYTCYSAA